MTNPIDESLPYHYDGPEPTEIQPVWHTVIHLLVPAADKNGNPVSTEAEASDYICETLRGQFLDWGYLGSGEDRFTPIHIVVSKPYVEGSFLLDDENDPG